MTQCLIAIGCNQGDCQAAINQACKKINLLPGTQLLATSGLLKTEPVGPLKGTFLNGAVLVETQLSPHQLLQYLLELEFAAGRRRSGSVDARPLDLDILLFGEEIIHTQALWVPHPRMTFRRFALHPAAEIAADMQHPEIGISLGRLAEHLRQRPNIIAVSLPRQFAIDTTHMNLSGEINWVNPPNAIAAQKLLQIPASSTAEWLVLLIQDAQTLATTEAQAKLRIVMSATRDSLQTPFANSWAGPLWNIPFGNQAQLHEQIMTAIQAMTS